MKNIEQSTERTIFKTKKRLVYRWFQVAFFLMAFLNSFGQSLDFSYQSPQPGAQFINPEQTLILKTPNGFEPSGLKSNKFIIKGSLSGNIGCNVQLSDDSKTLIVTPQKYFQYGEKVDITILSGLKDKSGNWFKAIHFDFYIKNGETLSLLKQYKQSKDCDFAVPESKDHINTDAEFAVNDNNLPSDYPIPTVVFGQNHAFDDQFIFMNMVCRDHTTYNNYLTILDNYGTPIFYQRTDLSSRDFRVLEDGYLAYSNNDLAHPEREKYYLLDSSYVIFDSVMMGNGYHVDGHDMLLLDNGHYLMMSYDPQLVNMSLIVPGGNPQATVVGLVIQEVDLERQVYFQWRSWDHFSITDATYDIDLTAFVIDYVHANSFEIDGDGNILLSCRHLDEITKINFNTGNIIWRFGLNSENNMFTVQNDPFGFSHQHDIRKLNNGHYTLYDNGNNHNPPFSQAMEYTINEQTMQAALVWSYQREGVYAPATGSFRMLGSGKKLIGWGTHYPLNITELNADNSVSFDLMIPQEVASYRAIKQPWKTNLFSAYRNLSLGNYAGHNSPKENYLHVHNHSSDTIYITSTYNHLEEFYLTTPLPFQILPNSTGTMVVRFEPTHNGNYNDLLTLNYDNPGNTRRIARQVNLVGIWNDSIPSVFINPSQGSSNVDPGTVITVTFDEPVRLATGEEITSQDIPDLVNFKLNSYSGDSVAFTGVINDNKTVITIYPENTLLENQLYFFVLRGKLVADYDGYVIQNPEVSYFETGTITGMESEDETMETIFPNPFTDLISIHFGGPGPHQVSVYNLNGQCLRRANTIKPTLSFDTQTLKADIYLISIVNQKDEMTHSYKVVKP